MDLIKTELRNITSVLKKNYKNFSFWIWILFSVLLIKIIMAIWLMYIIYSISIIASLNIRLIFNNEITINAGDNIKDKIQINYILILKVLTKNKLPLNLFIYMLYRYTFTTIFAISSKLILIILKSYEISYNLWGIKRISKKKKNWNVIKGYILKILKQIEIEILIGEKRKIENRVQIRFLFKIKNINIKQ